jgi:hypothetical protein
MAEKTATINRRSAWAGEMNISLKYNGKPFSKFIITERKKS